MNQFFSLSLALEDWFDKPLSALPKALRQRVKAEFRLIPWLKLSAKDRRIVALQCDYQVDPETEQERRFWWELAGRKEHIMTQIAEWESAASPTALDLAEKEKRLAGLRLELAHIEVEVFVGAIESVKATHPRLRPVMSVQDKLEVGSREWRSQNARNAANVLHEMPGGSRDKQRQIREKWATGNYTSRDICAEQECAALEMSISTARLALRNTPKPSRC